MKHYILKILTLCMAILCVESGSAEYPDKHVAKVHPVHKRYSDQIQVRVDNKKIKVDGRDCYLLIEVVDGKDTTRNVPFCGEFMNFDYKEGCVWNLSVSKIDFKEDTICVSGAIEGDFMILGKKKIQVDDKLCYSVMKGLSRRDTTKLEPFCGDFVFLRQIDRYKYENGDYFVVEKYDICADTIFVKQVYERWHKDRIPKKIKK